ncbi:MAG: NADH-quinone oxidoreductase subunit C [Nitrospirae bacterium]|nr:NADH-quinone oxidoreductase subunit C [Nitrospirota bacterium]MBI3352886.1 NADH-quinone oxidoreductase subunit C [Nitrospirota bacterium]
MDNLNEIVQEMVKTFKDQILDLEQIQGIPVFYFEKEDILEIATYVYKTPSLRGTLSLQWAADLNPIKPVCRVYYLFSLESGGHWLILAIDLLEEDRLFPSITPRIHAAKWYEREIRDMIGLIPVGHPDLRRLVRHEHWPRGTHPLKKDFPWNTVLERREGTYAYRHIEGEGVFEVPVGPIHAGIIEPGHFRFSVAGEPIMQLEIRLFWKHRGIEKLFENLSLINGVSLAEKVSGDTSFGHSLCYCQAVESLLSVEIPPRAEYLRTLFLELERLHNHIGDVGAICSDAAYSLALAHCNQMKEQIMQMLDRLAGHRFLRGVNRVGGVAVDLDSSQLDGILAGLAKIEEDFKELTDLLFSNASLIDRLETTGILKEQTARDYGVVGVAGRSSNINRDIRRDHPFAAYRHLNLKVPVYQYGDVRARVRVRVDEIHEAISIIRQVCGRIPKGPTYIEAISSATRGRWALSAVEGWRGEILYFVMAGENGRIHRCKVRDPSFVNWPVLQDVAPGNIIPDFPLINKSFNLSYAGNDL